MSGPTETMNVISALAVGLVMAVLFSLGSALFRVEMAAFTRRMPFVGSWVAYVAAAAVSLGLAFALRALILDQLDRPPSLPVVLGELLVVILLITGAYAIGLGTVQLLAAAVRTASGVARAVADWRRERRSLG